MRVICICCIPQISTQEKGTSMITKLCHLNVKERCMEMFYIGYSWTLMQ
jgi:hypothetical protein